MTMLRPKHLLLISGLLLAGVVWLVLHRPPPVPAAASAPSATPTPVVRVPAQAHPLAPVVVTGEARAPSVHPTDLPAALFDPAVKFALRLQWVHALGKDLPPDEVGTLLDYVRQASGNDGLSSEEREALKNDVILALRDQHTPPAGLTPTLVSLYQDPAQDPVMRDYAIQHLSIWFSQCTHTCR